LAAIGQRSPAPVFWGKNMLSAGVSECDVPFARATPIPYHRRPLRIEEKLLKEKNALTALTNWFTQRKLPQSDPLEPDSEF